MLKFLNALAALAAVGSFVIAFLDSYEVRFKVRRRTRGADGRRHLRRSKRKCWPILDRMMRSSCVVRRRSSLIGYYLFRQPEL